MLISWACPAELCDYDTTRRGGCDNGDCWSVVEASDVTAYLQETMNQFEASPLINDIK